MLSFLHRPIIVIVTAVAAVNPLHHLHHQVKVIEGKRRSAVVEDGYICIN